jgi:hypothetical protein
MTLKQQQIVNEQIKPYWYDEKQLIKEQTLVSEYEYNNHIIELKQQQFYFMNEPDNIGTYRTYVRIYKNGEMMKRRLWYIDNPDWETFVKNFIG